MRWRWRRQLVVLNTLTLSQVFEEVLSHFSHYASQFRVSLRLTDLLLRICNKIEDPDVALLELYVTHNNPLKKITFEKTAIGLKHPDRSLEEVNNFQAAHDYIMALCTEARAITREDIIRVNTLARGLNNTPELPLYNAARFIYVHKESSTLCAEPSDYQKGIMYLVDVMNAPPPMHPLVLASLVFYWLVRLHPFKDGNGRTARLICTYILKKHGYDLRHIAYEQYYVLTRKSYDNAQNFGQDFYAAGVSAPLIKQWMDYFIPSWTHAYTQLLTAKIGCKIITTKMRLFKTTPIIHKVICPAPTHIPFTVPSYVVRRQGKVAGQWAYRDSNGDIIAWKVRFAGNARNQFKKSYLYFQLFTDNKWHENNIEYNDSMSLYGLDKLSAPIVKKVIICEGEKCADAFNALVQSDEMIAISLPVGAYRLQEVDWEPLLQKKIEVCIWRDNDEAGKIAQTGICNILTARGFMPKVLSEDALQDKPEKWDVADAVAAGMTKHDMLNLLAHSMVPHAM